MNEKNLFLDEEKITVLQIAFYSHNYFDETKCLYFWLGIRRCNQRIIEERNRQNLQMLFLKFKRHFQNIFGTQKRKQHWPRSLRASLWTKCRKMKSNKNTTHKHYNRHIIYMFRSFTVMRKKPTDAKHTENFRIASVYRKNQQHI